MSLVSIGLNLLLAGLLLAALAMGFRLNGRLKALKDSHEGFARAVAELDAAAARAEQGLADLRAATDEATDALADRIEKARALAAKLDRQLAAEPKAAPVSSSLREAAARGDIALEADVERVTHTLGTLLAGARQPKPRRAPERPAPEARATRHAPSFEDELFDEPAANAPEPESAPARPLFKSVIGGRG